MRFTTWNGNIVLFLLGLDPAGPKFQAVLAKERIRLDDADFLDFIHGDTDTYGGNFQGHANFYPNGGKKQPGCGTLLAALGLLFIFVKPFQLFAISVASFEPVTQSAADIGKLHNGTPNQSCILGDSSAAGALTMIPTQITCVAVRIAVI